MSSTRGRWNTAVCNAINKNINNSEITDAIGKCQKLLFEEWQRQEVPKRPRPVKAATEAKRQREVKQCGSLFHALIQMAIEDDPQNEELQKNILSIFMGLKPPSAFPALIQSIKWTNFTKTAKTSLTSAVPVVMETVFNADKEAKLENWFQLSVVPVLRIIYEYLDVLFKNGHAANQNQVPRPAPQPVTKRKCSSYVIPTHKGTRMLISYKRKLFRKGGFLARIKREPAHDAYPEGVVPEEQPPPPQPVAIPQPAAQAVKRVTAHQVDLGRVKLEPIDGGVPAPDGENPLPGEVAIPPRVEVRREEPVAPLVHVKREVVERVFEVDSGNSSVAASEASGPSIQPLPADNNVPMDPQIRVKEEPVDEQPDPISAEPPVPVQQGSGSEVAAVEEEHHVPQPAPVNETPNLNAMEGVVEEPQPEDEEEGELVDISMEDEDEPMEEEEELNMTGDSDIIFLSESDVPAVQSTVVIDDEASVSSSDVSIASYKHILEELRLFDEEMKEARLKQKKKNKKKKAKKTAKEGAEAVAEGGQGGEGAVAKEGGAVAEEGQGGGGSVAEGGRQEECVLEEGECEVEEGEIVLEEGELESIDGVDCGGGADKKGANGGKGAKEKAAEVEGVNEESLEPHPSASEEQPTQAKKPAGDDFWETFARAAETYTPPPKKVVDRFLKSEKRKNLRKEKERKTKEQPPSTPATGRIQKTVKKQQNKEEKKLPLQGPRGAPEEDDRHLVVVAGLEDSQPAAAVENPTPEGGHRIVESPPYDEVYSEPPEPLPRDYPTAEEEEEGKKQEERAPLIDFSNSIDPFEGDDDIEDGQELDLVSSMSEDDLVQPETRKDQGDVPDGDKAPEPAQPEAVDAGDDLDFPLILLSKDRPHTEKRRSRAPIREMVLKLAQEEKEAAAKKKAAATSSHEVRPRSEAVVEELVSSDSGDSSKNLTRVKPASTKQIPQKKKRKMSRSNDDEEITEIRRYSLRTPGDAKRPRISNSSTRSLRSSRNQSETTPTLRNSSSSVSQVRLALYIDPVLKPWTPPKIDVPYYFKETTSAWPSFNCSGVIYIVESEENMPDDGLLLDDVPVAMILVGGEGKPKIKNVVKKMRPDALLKFALEEFVKRFD